MCGSLKSTIKPDDLSLLQICTNCQGKCCVGRTMSVNAERQRVANLAGCDHFVHWKDDIYYLDKGQCPYLQGGLCSVQAVKPFVCQIFPFVPRAIDGEFWLFCAGECDAATRLPADFIQRAKALARVFFKTWTPQQYEEYWLDNKQGDFDDDRVVLKVKIFD
jgi:Fe-S-cluster containining protein